MPEETLRENKMGTMPENKLLLSMAVPMMISMLVQALYNICLLYTSERRCSEAALSARPLGYVACVLITSTAL